MESSNQFLGAERIGKLMQKYAIPCIISLLVGALYNIVDQIFIANASYLGSYGNAANTVVFPLTVVALAIAVMIGDGCCAFVSISLGQNEVPKAKRSVGNAVVMCLASSIVLAVLYLVFADAGEYTPGGFLASAFTDRSFGPTNEDLLWKLQYRIIRELAEKEPCVIVGRCADFILQDRTDCLKIFIHADMKFRADRIVRVYGEREKSPEARLKEKDKRRAAYYRFYTDMKWGDAANYHIALDSGVIGIEKCAEIIGSLA